MQIKHRNELFKVIDMNLPCAEIGVAEGNFSRDMLEWGIVKLYMVDNWQTIPGQKGDGGHEQKWHDANYLSALLKVKPFGDKAVVLKGLSENMAKKVADNSLGLVYIDAAHDYTNVLNDLRTWSKKVVKGGIIAGHDYLNEVYGVHKAVHDFVKETDSNIEIHVIPELNAHDASFYFVKP